MYKAKTNILFDGMTYLIGDIIPISDPKQIKQLLESDSIELLPENVVVAEEEIKQPIKQDVGPTPNLGWKRNTLVGHAKKLGLIIDASASKEEILKLIENAPKDVQIDVEDATDKAKTPSVYINPDYVAPEPLINVDNIPVIGGEIQEK